MTPPSIDLDPLQDMGDKPQSSLATPEQRLTEERAIAVLASAEVREAVARTLAHFRSDRNAAYPGQDALIVQSVNEHFCHAALMACSETPRHPRFIWSLAHDHHWMGLKVPGSRFGQDNPDNCYRLAYIDPTLRYRITGRFKERRPVDFSICGLPSQVGEGIFADTRTFLGIDQIDTDAQGNFEILVEPAATGERRNHISNEGVVQLNVRDTLGDWKTERSCELSIVPLDVEAVDDFDHARACTRTAGLGWIIASFFLEALQHGYFERGAINTLNPPWSAGANGGLVTQSSSLGYYGLAEDEAMIITTSPLGARYIGMQITDIWMLSYEYRTRTSSLNHTQLRPDADGRFRWVISAQDPGVFNWLDGGGQLRGTILLRWHHLPGNIVPGADVITTEIVKLHELREHLPPDTRYVDAAGRAAQREQRLRDYQQRVA